MMLRETKSRIQHSQGTHGFASDPYSNTKRYRREETEPNGQSVIIVGRPIVMARRYENISFSSQSDFGQ